ncbi:MAG: UbiD family decarboxylase [Candidatus Atribacteria bacterium]|nr:UbiD family decarboxylase [Candidatus Atribacteria bacterium]
MLKDLRKCLKELERTDRLIRVKKKVDPKYEISAAAKVLHSKFKKAILFENVRDSKIPLITYIFPDRQSVADSLALDPQNLVKGWNERENQYKSPVRVNSAPVKEVIITKDIDLNMFPLVTHSTGDAGRYITGGMVIVKHPTEDHINASWNRLQYVDKNKLHVRMMPPQHLGRYHETAEKLDKPLPAVIVIGAPPALMFSAASKISFERNELEFAGALGNAPLEVIKAETVDVDIPANAEIVIEGEVLPHVREEEGPFGEFTDSFVPVVKNHVFHVKAITHRKNPIYHDIYAGSQEDLYLLGLPIEAEIYKHVKAFAPQITGISTTSFVFNCVISIKKENEEQPKNVILSALGSYAWTKMCIVVDDDVNIYDPGDVLWAIQTRCRPDRDIIIVPGVSAYTREDVKELHIGKVGIDATVPLHMKETMRRRVIPGEENIKAEDYLK